jgi:hypothetical protein
MLTLTLACFLAGPPMSLPEGAIARLGSARFRTVCDPTPPLYTA